jgi:hypothetical protein
MIPILGPHYQKTSSKRLVHTLVPTKDVNSSLSHKNPHTEPLILTLKTTYFHNTSRYPPNIIKQNKTKMDTFKEKTQTTFL